VTSYSHSGSSPITAALSARKFDLARTAQAGAALRRPAAQRHHPAIQQILDSQLAPAWAAKRRADIVAANRLGRALISPLFDDPCAWLRSRFRVPEPRCPATFHPTRPDSRTVSPHSRGKSAS
jgi:hypothetical protein